MKSSYIKVIFTFISSWKFNKQELLHERQKRGDVLAMFSAALKKFLGCLRVVTIWAKRARIEDFFWA